MTRIKIDRQAQAQKRLKKSQERNLTRKPIVKAAYQSYRNKKKSELLGVFSRLQRIHSHTLRDSKTDIIYSIMEAEYGIGWGIVFEK